MNTRTTAPAAWTLRQRLAHIIAIIGFLLAMLLGGGAPHDLNGKPTPTPVVAPTS